MAIKHSHRPITGVPSFQPAPEPAPDPTPPGRSRITVDVSPSVSAILDYYCEITGQTRSSVIQGLLMAQLPGMAELADNLKRRASSLLGGKR